MSLSSRAGGGGDDRLTILRIFVASPSDVVGERRLLRAVVDELNVPDGRHPGLFTTYRKPKGFQDRVRQDLTRLLPVLAEERRAAEALAASEAQAWKPIDEPATGVADGLKSEFSLIPFGLLPRESRTFESSPASQKQGLSNALYMLLTDYFSLNELHELAYKMNIDFENLAGETKKDKARELVGYCQRRDRLDELIQLMIQERPHLANRLINREPPQP